MTVFQEDTFQESERASLMAQAREGNIHRRKRLPAFDEMQQVLLKKHLPCSMVTGLRINDSHSKEDLLF